MRAAAGLTLLVLVPAILGSWPLTLASIIAALVLAMIIGAAQGAAGPAPVRQARPRRRGPSLGLGVAVPLPGPLYAFLTFFRVRRP